MSSCAGLSHKSEPGIHRVAFSELGASSTPPPSGRTERLVKKRDRQISRHDTEPLRHVTKRNKFNDNAGTIDTREGFINKPAKNIASCAKIRFETLSEDRSDGSRSILLYALGKTSGLHTAKSSGSILPLGEPFMSIMDEAHALKWEQGERRSKVNKEKDRFVEPMRKNDNRALSKKVDASSAHERSRQGSSRQDRYASTPSDTFAAPKVAQRLVSQAAAAEEVDPFAPWGGYENYSHARYAAVIAQGQPGQQNTNGLDQQVLLPDRQGGNSLGGEISVHVPPPGVRGNRQSQQHAREVDRRGILRHEAWSSDHIPTGRSESKSGNSEFHVRKSRFIEQNISNPNTDLNGTMSFLCDTCGEILGKKKIDSHKRMCRASYFRCTDCTMPLNGPECKSHRFCMPTNLVRDQNSMVQMNRQGRTPNGLPPSHAWSLQQQLALLQRKRAMLKQQAAMQQMNGGQGHNPAQMAQLAQQQAQAERAFAIAQAAMIDALQPQHISPAPNDTAAQYQAQVRKQMMQSMSSQQVLDVAVKSDNDLELNRRQGANGTTHGREKTWSK